MSRTTRITEGCGGIFSVAAFVLEVKGNWRGGEGREGWREGEGSSYRTNTKFNTMPAYCGDQ